MITDAQNTLSASQAVTATAFSGNTIDLGALPRDIGAGEELNIYVNVEQTVTAAGAATVNFQFVSSSAPNLATNTTILIQTDAVPKATLVQGAQMVIPVPRSALTRALSLGQRYIGLQYTIGTGPLTAGIFSAGIVVDAPDNTGIVQKYYPSGFAVK